MRKSIGLLVGVALVLLALMALTIGATQASPRFTGAVCPQGDVKINIGPGYEYTDGSATITGDANSVCWTAAPGYEITSVCIKIGGPGGGSLIDGGSGNGCGGPYAYGISHVVVTTDELPPEPTPTLPPSEPTPTLPPGPGPTPTSPPWEPTPPNWPLCWPRINVGLSGCVPEGGAISQWFEGNVLSDRKWVGEIQLYDVNFESTYLFKFWSQATGSLTIGEITTGKEIKGQTTCEVHDIVLDFPCAGPTPVPPPPQLPVTGIAQLTNPWVIFSAVGMLGAIAAAGAVRLKKRR